MKKNTKEILEKLIEYDVEIEKDLDETIERVKVVADIYFPEEKLTEIQIKALMEDVYIK